MKEVEDGLLSRGRQTRFFSLVLREALLAPVGEDWDFFITTWVLFDATISMTTSQGFGKNTTRSYVGPLKGLTPESTLGAEDQIPEIFRVAEITHRSLFRVAEDHAPKMLRAAKNHVSDLYQAAKHTYPSCTGPLKMIRNYCVKSSVAAPAPDSRSCRCTRYAELMLIIYLKYLMISSRQL